MLELKNLNFHYGTVQALYDIDMTMPPGQITCVMGRNGVGKTTLLKNIMGSESATSGTIALQPPSAGAAIASSVVVAAPMAALTRSSPMRRSADRSYENIW